MRWLQRRTLPVAVAALALLLSPTAVRAQDDPKDVQFFTAVIEGQRVADGGFANRNAFRGLGERSSFAVDPVAGLAGYGGLIGQVGAGQMPWAGGALRLHNIADAAIEVHAVAAEAVVHEAAAGVVLFVSEDR